ncbi:MAG: polyprenyl synthetase family protein [Desulfobacteraceae bacterium]|nr:polyprenyl synthetase family protein [Desulfobacteraceae bacterium]MBC2753430.1 polyprenyl synthetase family protein [Desulfobacteraceae bacterium]
MNDLKTRILSLVKDELVEIEAELVHHLNPHLDLVREVAGHILFSGGKRLRPLLLVLAARMCDYRGDYDKTFSISLEYLHAATLLHDDLIDEADLRRGRPVAHSIWGNATTILVGDFLLARALTIAAGTGNIDIIKVVAGITENMSQGEIHQLSRKGDLSLNESEYREVIWRKTAVLFEGACRSAALLADASPDRIEALSTYGVNLGLAFQMADDLIDYTSDTQELGKKAGADLREGKLTLPVIAALQAADSRDHARMASIIRNPSFTTEDFEALKALLQHYGGLAYTREKAREHVRLAKEALSKFKPSETTGILHDLADFTLQRRA